MDKDLQEFLNNEFILTLSTFDGKKPYSTPLFYYFFKGNLFFLSDLHTKHASHISNYPLVSAAIFRATRVVSEIQGVQLTGQCFFLESTENINPKTYKTIKNQKLHLYTIYQNYCQKFPEAKELKTFLWGIFPEWIKFINNKIHFGHKKEWRLSYDSGN